MAQRKKSEGGAARMRLTSIDDVIEALGGTAGVSKLLTGTDRKRPMVAMWRKRGHVPGGWRPALAKLLEAEGYEPPEGFLDPTPSALFRPVGTTAVLNDQERAFAPE